MGGACVCPHKRCYISVAPQEYGILQNVRRSCNMVYDCLQKRPISAFGRDWSFLQRLYGCRLFYIYFLSVYYI